MKKTALCQRLGIEYPVFSAGLGGGMAGPELAAAVSSAGGLGVLGMLGVPPQQIRENIARVRAATDKPFAVNLVLPLMQGNEVETCLEEKVPVLVFFWGDVTPYVAEAHRHGTQVIVQVGSVEEARRAATAGVDAIMAQGVEAGGHVRGTTALSILVPSVVEAVQPVPVVATGGIADGRGLVAALDLGAQAVSMGTRFLCSDEAQVARVYKERVVQSTAEDTVRTTLFDIGWPDAPHRTLRNKAVTEWEAAGRPPSGQRPGEGSTIGRVELAAIPGMAIDVLRYSTIPPLPGFNGDIEYAVLYAGQSCSLIHDIKPAGQIVRDIMRQADAIFAARS